MPGFGRVLVADDEADIVEIVRKSLEQEGYEVFVATDGVMALDMVRKVSPDVIVLDVMMPGMDGLTVCKEIRKSRNVAILILSARGDDVDRILGLEVGADDYLPKPFNRRELIARVRAMFRRLKMGPSDYGEGIIIRDPLRINTALFTAELDGQPVPLTPLEFSLLKVLAAQAGGVLTRQDLLNRVWGPEFIGDERTVDTHIRNLRVKLQSVKTDFQPIQSVWGVGYKYQA